MREKLQGGKIVGSLPTWIYSVNPHVETGRAFCPWDQNKQDLERGLTNPKTLAIGRIEGSPEGVISEDLKGFLRPNPPPSCLLITEIHQLWNKDSGFVIREINNNRLHFGAFSPLMAR